MTALSDPLRARRAGGVIPQTFRIPTLAMMHAADPEQFVADYPDLAAVNLTCSEGLPHNSDLDIPACLEKLDFMAEWLKRKLRGAGTFTIAILVISINPAISSVSRS